jgi:uridine kinase
VNVTRQVENLAHVIAQRKRGLRSDRALLAAISGIDGSGKSTLALQLAAALGALGLHAVKITLDLWHTPPATRFSEEDPGGHFYQHAFRWSEMFEQLIEPLKRNRRVHLTAEVTRQPENDRILHTYAFENVDVIVLEGIFLFKREHLHRYDVRCWVECSFETALARALRRNQEGLSPEEIHRDYKEIYFYAQRAHFQRDLPRVTAEFIIENDADNATASSSAGRAVLPVSASEIEKADCRG